MSYEAKLKELGIELPEIPTAGGNYLHAVLSGNHLYLSGKVDRSVVGKVGAEITLEQAYQAARHKVLGMVNSAPDFGKHPAVINGFSDLFIEIFGDNGRHARSAVGMAALPNQVAVEIEAIIEVQL